MDHDTQQDIAKSRLRHIEPLGSSVEVPYRSSHETITGQPVETSARSSLAINCETSTMRTSVRPKGSTPKARNSDGSAAKMLYSFDEAIHSNLKVEVASTLPTSQHHRGKETYGGREIEKIVHLKLTKTCHVWKWEMITWLMGSFAFIANLILLTWFNGTLQKDWNCRIQITTFVAALAQASQSALLVPITSSMAQLRWRWVSSCSRPAEDIEIFDLASRGPYGSVALLWHFAWKQQLASIGALSTILLLGFPTFIQQAIQLDTKEVEVITKSIPVDYYFTPVPERINVSSHQELSQSPWFSIGSTVLPEFKTNIERALMDNAAASSERNFGNLCKSDKCAWEQYPVLSICSRVENVSDSILFDDQYSILFGDPYTIPKPPHAAIEGQNFTEIGAAPVPYQIPYDSEFHIQTKFFAADRLNSSDDPTGLLQTRATPNNTMTHMSDVAHVYLTHWNSCRAPNYKDSHEKPQLWWSAYKATFSLCVQTYKTSYNVSGWHTATLAQYLDLEWHSVKKSSKGQEDQASSGDLDVMRCAHWPEDANLDPSLRKPSCIHEKMLRLIGGQLATFLDIKANLSGDPFGYKGDSQWTSILVSDFIGDCSDTKGMRGFAARTEKIAMSLTESKVSLLFPKSISLVQSAKSISFLVGGGAYPVRGMAYQREGAIKVNFFWLILPSTLYLLLSWFLFATMYQTSDLPPWKYSTLAVLWCKEGSSNRPSTKKQMEARGKQAKVQLVEEDNAWRLVETYEMS